MNQELSNKVAIVTGGANGLGRASVELFMREGAKVVIADVDEAGGEALAAALGPSVRFRRTNVSLREEVEALVNYAVAEFGGLDVMFNNAGITDKSMGRLLDDDFRHFERVMQIDVLGVMLGTQIAARHMARSGGGSIINTASIGGALAGHGFPVYRAAKAGVITFTKSAAIELGEHLIRVNCLCPGNIPTGLGTYAPAPGMTPEQGERMRGAIAAVRLQRQPLKRQGEPIDVAQTALFLASERSRHMTGQVLTVDGGATAGDPRSLIEEILEIRSAASPD